MLCATCQFDINISCKQYNETYNTNMLCIFKKFPNDIIQYILEYIHHYDGHIITYYEYVYSIKNHNAVLEQNEKKLCSPCFQYGLYKKMYNITFDSFENTLSLFSSWMDDKYIKIIKNKMDSIYLPKKMDINRKIFIINNSLIII